jgi:hypothetical protein
MTAWGFSDGCCAAPLVASAGRVTEAAASESKEGFVEEECEDGEAPAWCFCCVAAGDTAASNSNIAAIQASRLSNTPNGKQTLQYAAVEELKAAPPNASCLSPAGPGVGRPCVDPGRAGVSRRALFQIR